MCARISKAASAKSDQEFLGAFSAEAATTLFTIAGAERLDASRATLLRLCADSLPSTHDISGAQTVPEMDAMHTLSVPQVLLFEGGTEQERQAMALWWAALQHCQQNQDDGAPCGLCPHCMNIAARMHTDVLAFDGRISNTDDAANPGPVRALNKENTEALKLRLGDTTRSGGKRVVIMSGIETKRSAAANALLKVLEEPSPTTIFVLLAAQREQLLPTLVSRSWVITLPWPPSRSLDPDFAPWENALAHFLSQRAKGTEQAWWRLNVNKTATMKDGVDAEKAQHILLLCQKCLMSAMAPTTDSPTHTASPLIACFARLSSPTHLHIASLINDTQDMIQYSVHPSRCLDSFAFRLSLLCKGT